MGFWQILAIAKLENKSLMGVQVGFVSVISVVFHNPPPTLAAKTVFPVASFLSIIIARVLPPTLEGPRSSQLMLSAPATL